MNSRNLFTLKDVLLFFYLFALRILATIFPIKMIRLIGILLGYIYSSISVSKKRALQKSLTLAFIGKETRGDIKKISNQLIRNVVSRAIDDLILNRLRKKDLLKCSEIKGLENLETALSAKKGVILVSGHFFASRVAKRFLSEIGFPVLSVGGKPAGFSSVGAKYLKSRYVEFMKSVIDDQVLVRDPNFGLKTLRCLRENGLVNVHIDGPWSHQKVRLPFLGEKRSFPAGFLRIADLTGAAVVPMLCLGNSKSFTVILEKPFEIRKTSDSEKFISSNLERLVSLLESQILQYPDQWCRWGWRWL